MDTATNETIYVVQQTISAVNMGTALIRAMALGDANANSGGMEHCAISVSSVHQQGLTFDNAGSDSSIKYALRASIATIWGSPNRRRNVELRIKLSHWKFIQIFNSLRYVCWIVLRNNAHAFNLYSNGSGSLNIILRETFIEQ